MMTAVVKISGRGQGSPHVLAAHSRDSTHEAITSITPVGGRSGEGALGFSVALRAPVLSWGSSVLS